MDNNIKDKGEKHMISSVKCYKSIPCITSMLIVVFIIAAILYDFIIEKPKMQHDISDINMEIININNHIEKIDCQQQKVYKDFLKNLNEKSISNKKLITKEK